MNARGAMMWQINIIKIVISVLFLFKSVLAQEKLTLEECRSALKAMYSLSKQEICTSIRYENEIRNDKSEFVEITEVRFTGKIKSGVNETIETKIRRPTSVAIQDERDQRIYVRNDFKERVDNILKKINTTDSLVLEQYKEIKSYALGLEVELDQDELKLCKKP